MCINSARQGYRIASSTAVTSQCYAEFFMQSRGITSGKTYTCQKWLCYKTWTFALDLDWYFDTN